MAENPLRTLNQAGQSVWQDYIRRKELLEGDLKRLIDEDGISGVTSNPTIFEKAIAGSNDYDASIRQRLEEGLSGPRLFERLAVEDIQKACDLFRGIYGETRGGDGYVSIEVAPNLARDTKGTIEEARRLWQSVNRPNLLVKIPGTAEGLPAIEQCLYEGVNINITLLFAVERYVEVAEAYLRALERRVRDTKSVEGIGSVASFFVSRIDSLVDKQLEQRLQAAKSAAEKQKIDGLIGKTAIANAKLAYVEFKRIFSGARWEPLANAGAKVQRVLWASTSTKNPKYRDVIYVEQLIGPQTVNTMPPATIVAFRDHGKVQRTLDADIEVARQEMAALAEVGIDMAAVTKKLEDDGVASFTKDYTSLIKTLEEKREQFLRASRASVAG